MKATITIVAMALTAWAVAPQRGFAQYGPAAPFAPQPALMGPGPASPYAASPPGYQFHPVAPAAYQAPAPPPPPGAHGPAGGAYGPAAPYYGGGVQVDPGYTEGYAGDANCDTCDTGWAGGAGLAPVFFGAEALLWIRHGQQVPVLVTTDNPGANPATAGVLGQSGIPIFGGERIEDGFQPGFRLTSGVWLDPLHEVAIGGRIFALGEDETEFNASAPAGQPIIARPFLSFADPNNPAEAAFVVAFAGAPGTDPRTGALEARVTNNLWGGDAFTSVLLTQGVGYRIDMQAGYQYYRIDEAVEIRSSTTQGDDFFNDNIPNGTTLSLADLFDTQNEFHGGALGLLTEIQQGSFSLKVLGRLAVGNMRETVRVQGVTTITPPPPAMGAPFPPVSFPGGVLAQTSNIGELERDRTVVSPELGITLGYNPTPSTTFTLGYSFIYWTHVAQAGPQIDRRADLTQANAFPVLDINDSDYWVMGLNGGFEWRY